jgi:hypothetical protein
MEPAGWAYRGSGDVKLLFVQASRCVAARRCCVPPPPPPRRARARHTPASRALSPRRRTRLVMTDGTTKRVLLNHYVQPDAVLRPAPSEQDDRARAFSFSAHDAAAAAASPAGTPAGKLTFALRFKAEAAAGACGAPPR